MTERMIQVPESLIESAADAMATMGEMADSNALRALLSQPNPTTEHDGHTVVVGPLLNDPFAEPHRIEDMVPGARFKVGDAGEFVIGGRGEVLQLSVQPTPWTRQHHPFDQSTIRNVTPPNGDDRG